MPMARGLVHPRFPRPLRLVGSRCTFRASGLESPCVLVHSSPRTHLHRTSAPNRASECCFSADKLWCVVVASILPNRMDLPLFASVSRSQLLPIPSPPLPCKAAGTVCPRAMLPTCWRACTNLCSRARDHRCQDGWTGDDTHEGKPACALGSDCADCGPRQLCSVLGVSGLNLPAAALPMASRPHVPTRTALHVSQILFMVMGSSRFRKRTLRAADSWCARDGARCVFFADDDPPYRGNALDSDPLPFVRVRLARPPKHCCSQKSQQQSGTPFFCEPHRAATLRAQYRFLPALSHVRSSAAFASGKLKCAARGQPH